LYNGLTRVPEAKGKTSKAFAITWYRAPNVVLFASTSVSCAGHTGTRYWAAREPLPRVPTAFPGSKCVRGELKRRKYQVEARYQGRANALLSRVLRGVSNVLAIAGLSSYIFLWWLDIYFRKTDFGWFTQSRVSDTKMPRFRGVQIVLDSCSLFWLSCGRRAPARCEQIV